MAKAAGRRWNVQLRTAAIAVGTVAMVSAATPVTAQSTVRFDARTPQCISMVPPVIGVDMLPATRAALRRGSLRVLAIGSSSTSGVGASSAQAAYPARLQQFLTEAFRGRKIRVLNRGIPGETLVGASVRLKSEATTAKPDLVLWQLGTNGALRKVRLERIRDIVTRSLLWLRSRNIDVLLIDPQYVARLARLDHYSRVVDEIALLATRNRVGLIRRFASMRDIALRYDLKSYLAADNFHLNDLGYRCLANYAAHAIVTKADLDR